MKIIRNLLIIVFILSLVLSISGCSNDAYKEGYKEGYDEGYNAAKKEYSSNKNPDNTETPKEDNTETPKETAYTYVEMSVKGYGKIILKLDHSAAPETVANFVSLVNKGFYDNLTFHRIIKDFMIQGGDPKANGTGGNTDANGKEINIKGEFSSNGHNNPISHKRGVISMARSNDPNSASSQFFICNADASESLDGQYAAFGWVIEGMDVVDAITDGAFPKTDYYDYYGNYDIDPVYGMYKHYVWQYLGNGTLSNKADQPVIEYIKVLPDYAE